MDVFEVDGFVRCSKFQTAVNALGKKLEKHGMLHQVDLSPNYFNNTDNKDFHEYFKNEDGTFFRMNIEEVDEGYWYIDCGFSI